MAWTTKYRLEFYDNYGDYYKLQFLKDGASGSVIELKGTGTPLQLSYFGNGNDYSPVRGSQLRINLYTRRPLEFMDFYEAGDLTWLVQLERNNEIIWIGYLNTDITINYDCEPAEVTLTAVDGLAYLKEINYDDDGTPYNGYKTIIQIIFDILSKLNFGTYLFGVKEFINLYERGILKDESYSALDQIYVNTDVFAGKDCYYVLSEILKTFNATIFQKDGIFHIVRSFDLNKSDFSGRYFTDSTTKDLINVTDNILTIERAGAGILGDFLAPEGGTVEFLPAASEVKINFDYGNRQSWIDNYNFDAEKFDYINSEAENWNNSAASDITVKHISEFVQEEKNGIALRRTSSADDVIISQYFGSKSKITDEDYITFEFDYGFYNTTNSDIEDIQAKIMILHNDKVLSRLNNEYYQWGLLGSSDIIRTDAVTVEPGWSGWKHFRGVVPSLLYNGEDYNIYIGLFCAWKSLVGNNSNVYACFKELKFYATSSRIATKKKVRSFWQRLQVVPGDALINVKLRNKYYNVKYREQAENICEKEFLETNTLKGQKINIDTVLGDVVDSNLDNRIEQFQGQLINSDDEATTNWIKFENIHKYQRHAIVRNAQNDNTLSSTQQTPMILLDKGYDAGGYWYEVGQMPDPEKFGNLLEEPEAWGLWDLDVEPQPDTVAMKVTQVEYIGFDVTYGYMYKLWTYDQIAGAVAVGHRMALVRPNSKYVYIKNTIDFPKNTGTWNATFTVSAAGIFVRHTDGKYCTIVSGYNKYSAVPKVKHHLFSANHPLDTWTDETGASSGDMFAGYYPAGYYGFNTITNCIPVPGEANYYVSAVGFFNSVGNIVAFGILKYNDTFTDISSWVLDTDYTPTIGYVYYYSINYYNGKWYYTIHDGTGNTGKRIVLSSNSLTGTYSYHSYVFDFSEMNDLSMMKNAVGYGGLQVVGDKLYFTSSGEGYDPLSGNYHDHEIFLFKYNEADNNWLPISYPFFTAKHGTGFEFPSWAYDHGGPISSVYEEDGKLYFVFSMCAGTDTYQATTGWMMKYFWEDNYYELNDLITKELAYQMSSPRQVLNLPVLFRQDDTIPNLMNAVIDPINIDESQTNIRDVINWTTYNCELNNHIENETNYIYVKETGVSSYFYKDIDFDGATHQKLYIRYKTLCKYLMIKYKTDYHDYSNSYYKDVTSEIINDGNWHVIVVDMSVLTAGEDDWVKSIIKGIMIYMPYAVIDFIGFARIYWINKLDYDLKKRQGNISLTELKN